MCKNDQNILCWIKYLVTHRVPYWLKWGCFMTILEIFPCKVKNIISIWRGACEVASTHVRWDWNQHWNKNGAWGPDWGGARWGAGVRQDGSRDQMGTGHGQIEVGISGGIGDMEVGPDEVGPLSGTHSPILYPIPLSGTPSQIGGTPWAELGGVEFFTPWYFVMYLHKCKLKILRNSTRKSGRIHYLASDFQSDILLHRTCRLPSHEKDTAHQKTVEWFTIGRHLMRGHVSLSWCAEHLHIVEMKYDVHTLRIASV